MSQETVREEIVRETREWVPNREDLRVINDAAREARHGNTPEEEQTGQIITTVEEVPDFRSKVRYHVREAYAEMLIASDQGVPWWHDSDYVVLDRLRQIFGCLDQ